MTLQYLQIRQRQNVLCYMNLWQILDVPEALFLDVPIHGLPWPPKGESYHQWFMSNCIQMLVLFVSMQIYLYNKRESNLLFRLPFEGHDILWIRPKIGPPFIYKHGAKYYSMSSDGHLHLKKGSLPNILPLFQGGRTDTLGQRYFILFGKG